MTPNDPEGADGSANGAANDAPDRRDARTSARSRAKRSSRAKASAALPEVEAPGSPYGVPQVSAGVDASPVPAVTDAPDAAPPQVAAPDGGPLLDETQGAAASAPEPAPPSAEVPGEPRPEGRGDGQGDGHVQRGGPTRSAPEAIQVDKAAGRAGLSSISAGQAAGTIAQQVARRGVRGATLKLPEFPPPVVERPEPLKEEEVRRVRIRDSELERRAKLRAGKTPQQLARLEEEWAADDALHYKIDPDDRELEIYPIKEPFAYVQLILNERTHEKLYHVIEPRLDHDEKVVLHFIEQTLIDILDLQPAELDKNTLEEYIMKKFDEVVADYSIVLTDPPEPGEAELEPEARKERAKVRREKSRARMLYYVLRDFIGEGPIDVLLHDAMIEDISCDGPHQPIFIYHRKYEPLTTTVRFRGHDQLDSFVIRMAQRSGKHVSIAEPILDATMRDGSRLQATLAREVSSFGSTFTIRKFRDIPFSPVDLVRFGTMAARMLAYLWMVIQYHQSAIYSGGTASGKTTAINAIMLFIPPNNKVVTIEDTREINIPQPNWIAGITRGGFGPRDSHGRQAGEIDMFQLLKNALRQRPEYIIVGEVRGAEAYNLFQAMATGHAAYGTMHADSVDAVIHRLESDPINIPRSLLEALDVVSVQIQTRVGGKRVRRTKQITEIVGLDPNTREILTNEVFRWEPAQDKFIFSGVSYSLERIAAEAGLTSDQVMTELEDRTRAIEWMVKQEIREYKTVAQIIHTYYYDRKRVMEHVDANVAWTPPPTSAQPPPGADGTDGAPADGAATEAPVEAEVKPKRGLFGRRKA